MKILVLGGSYFLGKHFVRIVSDSNEVTVFNRGNRPLNMASVNEIYGDRNNREALACLRQQDFDVVVDFCAYNPGDISIVVDVIGGKIKQYVFISTADVYKKGTKEILDESSPLDTNIYAGEVGQYIAGKNALEKELVECCRNNDIAFTSIRPAFIYGPDNYAPREGIFFNWIEKAGQVLVPEDATGCFQMVYVDDLAEIIYEICGNEKYFTTPINVCGTEIYNYNSFLDALEEGLGKSFQRARISVSDVLVNGIGLPFPLTKEESERYDSIFGELNAFYKTKLSQGLKNAYDSF